MLNRENVYTKILVVVTVMMVVVVVVVMMMAMMMVAGMMNLLVIATAHSRLHRRHGRLCGRRDHDCAATASDHSQLLFVQVLQHNIVSFFEH